MSSATLCFSGFSRDELAQVQQLFEQANAGLGQGWSLVSELEAQVLVRAIKLYLTKRLDVYWGTVKEI